MKNNMSTYTKSHLQELLRSNQCQITFTKVDGTVRIMPCSLREQDLPVRVVAENRPSRPEKEDNLSVWCLDKKEWRSFRVSNVTDVEVMP